MCNDNSYAESAMNKLAIKSDFSKPIRENQRGYNLDPRDLQCLILWLTYPITIMTLNNIQIADAFACCTLAHNMNQKDFDQYWNIIYEKFRKSGTGRVTGYGYKKFPV